MGSNAFIFKQFKIEQNQCAMKIGTDGILLAAWTSLENNPHSILDIGAGTGVLSLMLAQRSASMPAAIDSIDAIEIDANAFEQCVTNFEQSPWGDRLFCYHASLEEFTEEIESKYDLIICNPPFYTENYKTKNKQRNLARFQDAMPFNHLIESVSKLLSNTGTFSVVIPYQEEANFINIALKFNLFPNKILHVKGHEASKIKRSFITFSLNPNNVKISALTIETARHLYTDDYSNLTKDFYLKM